MQDEVIHINSLPLSLESFQRGNTESTQERSQLKYKIQTKGSSKAFNSQLQSTYYERRYFYCTIVDKLMLQTCPLSVWR